VYLDGRRRPGGPAAEDGLELGVLNGMAELAEDEDHVR